MKSVKRNLGKLLFCLAINLSFLNLVFQNNQVQAAKATMNVKVEIWQESSESPTGRCYGPYYTTEKPVFVQISHIFYNGIPMINKQDPIDAGAKFMTFHIRKDGKYLIDDCYQKARNVLNNGYIPVCKVNMNESGLPPNQTKTRKINVKSFDDWWGFSKVFDKSFNIQMRRTIDEKNCFSEPAESSFDLCLQISDRQDELKDRCIECFEAGGVWTAIGCVPQTSEGIISTIMEIGLIMAGAITLIMILVGAFMLSTSQGDPKKTQEAKELITSAIIGLLFIIFSVTILQFIGVSVIKIPGFGEL